MRVLIVDDSPTARAQARFALEEAQHTLADDLDVTEADGGVDALRQLATADVDLLLVDLHMPEINGLELLAFWKTRAVAGARAVVMSTAVSVADREKAQAHGAVAFCEKPVSSEALVTALSTLRG
jgi:CheY-like chemotaxis protein